MSARCAVLAYTACVLALTRVLANAQQQMCLLLREAMTVGKIALAREFFSNELGASAAKQRIKDELSSYCVVTEAPKTTFGKARDSACLICATGVLSASAVCVAG